MDKFYDRAHMPHEKRDYTTPKGPPPRSTEVNASESFDAAGKPMLRAPKGVSPIEADGTGYCNPAEIGEG